MGQVCIEHLADDETSREHDQVIDMANIRYVADYGDREKATAIAALIAGPENVSDRMRDRDEMAYTSPTQG